jgi:hypothetical protein
MKKIATFILGLVAFTTQAQPPQGFSYQAALRNADGQALANQSVNVLITLSNADGSTNYFMETHAVNSGINGVVSLPVGFGSPLLGTIAGVPWGQAEVYIKTDVKPQGQSQYINMGRTRLLSVPFALYAASGNQGADGIDGRTILNGTTNPTAGIGEVGDFYINTTNKTLFGPKTAQGWGTGTSIIGPQGATGPQGIAGATGADGKTILNGNANPITTQGSLGDFYLNTATNILFGPKTASGWGTGVSLVGPQGIQGAQGVPGQQGIQGEPGIDGRTILNGTADPAAGTGLIGDFYLNTATNMLFGPKSTSGWETVVSLIGPQGIQGVQGTPGQQGIQGEQGPQGLDGISITWLGTFNAAPANPQFNQAYYNSTDKKSFVFDGTTWQLMTQDGADAISAVTGTGAAGKIAV